MGTTISTRDVRERIAAILTELKESGEPVFIRRHGRVEGVLVAIEQYRRMLDRLEDLDDELDEALGRRILEERAAHARDEGQAIEALDAELIRARVSG
jgi:PHD/YefM family antitoxin component YafN of YafNO toxin-antitoxin module